MSSSRKIHQLVHTLSYGDAISGEVLAMQRVLKNLGFDSEIYAINEHPKLKGASIDYREFNRSAGGSFDGGVILHYSLGSPLSDLYRSLNSANRTLIYHNLTPAKWFEGVNPRIVADIRRGEVELPELCKLSNRLLADSGFNASELSRFGFNAEVLELPLDPKRWELDQNPGIANVVRSEPGIHLLHVGRLAPNKRIEDIIKVFYFLHHHFERQSRLWLSGIDIDTEAYSFALKQLVYELNLGHAVNFVGCLDDSELKALYQNASCYLCMSEHEGFCLPVAEAMHFGLPVLSFASSALVETVGDGGILFTEKRPAELAALIHKLSEDSALRTNMIEAGRRRVARLSFDAFQSRVSEIFQGQSESRSQSRIGAAF